MWKYAIHGRNPELIKYLEDKQISPPFDNYETILLESIKCHHNDVSNHIIRDLIEEENDDDDDVQNKTEFNGILYRVAVENLNFSFCSEKMKYEKMFIHLCELDYYMLAKLYLQEGNVDINSMNIGIFKF